MGNWFFFHSLKGQPPNADRELRFTSKKIKWNEPIEDEYPLKKSSTMDLICANFIYRIIKSFEWENEKYF